MKRPRKVNYTIPQYSFGGWLKKNASWLAPVGAAIGTIATGGLAAPALLPAAGAATAGTAAAGAGAALVGGAGLAGTTAATAGLGAATGAAGGLGLGTIGAGLGVASKVGGAISDKANQDDAVAAQKQAVLQQNAIQHNNQLTDRLQKNQIQNIPTYCKGGRTMKKIKKYPGGGVNNVFGNPLANLQTPNGVVVDRGDIPLIDTSIGDSMSTRREELVNYGSLNNPQLYSDIRNSDSPESKTASYLSALKTGTGNEGSTPYTRTLLDNANKSLGVDRGFFYNPEGAGMAHVTETTNPTLYKQLKAQYTIHNTNDVSGKRLQSSGSMGVGTATYAKGGYVADSNMTANSELEDQEVFRTPQGGMFQLNGATHAEGGIPMNLPQGTEILGKNNIPGTNKSFKEYGAKLMKDYNKYTKILDSKPTGLARKTAERMIDNINNDYTNTMALQESLKSVANNTAKYPDGGVQDEQIQLQDWMLDPRKGWGNQNAMNPLISDMQRYGSNKVSTQPRSFNGEAVMGQIMDYAPIAYNLAQGLFNKPQSLKASDYYNPNENQATNLMANRRYNVNPELEANRNAQINYTRALRQGAPSQAQYLGSIQNSQTARSRSDAEAIARKQNMDNAYMGEEAQMRANLGQQRAATNLAIQDINDKNKSAARSYIPTALSQLQQANQVNRLMKNMKKTDAQKAKLLQGMFRGYGFNKYFNTEE